jgi:hypothetical protein
METKDKIAVLMKEYDTLRAEMLARINTRFGIIGALIAFSAFWFGRATPPSLLKTFLIAIPCYCIIIGLWIWIGVLMEMLSAGIKRIEERINDLVNGEESPGGDYRWLQWESRGRSPVFRTILGKIVQGGSRVANRNAESGKSQGGVKQT